MNKLLKKLYSSLGFWEAIAKGFNWLLLASLPLFLSEASYGTVALLASYLLLISNVGIIGQNKVILRFVTSKNNQFIPYTIVISSLTTIIIFGIAIIFLNITSSFYLQLFLASILFTNYLLYIAFARKVMNHAEYAKVRIGYALTRLIVGLAMLIMFEDPVYYLYAEIVAIILGLFIIRDVGFFRISKFNLSDEHFSKALFFGSPLLIHSLSTYALSYADRLIMAFYLTNDDVGRYVALYTYAASLSFIYAILTVSKEPQIYDAKDLDTAEAIARDYLKQCLMYGVLVSVVIFIFYYLVFVQLKGVDTDAMLAFSIVIFGHLIIPFYFKMNYLLARLEKTSLISISSVIAAIANVLLNIVLIPTYGIIGAAITTSVSYLLLYILTRHFYTKNRKQFLSNP